MGAGWPGGNGPIRTARWGQQACTIASMEFESEARVILSPGARVVVGSRLLPLACVAALGLIVGVVVATMVGCRRRGRARRRRSPGRSLGPPLRLPGEYPDVETEL